MVFSSIFFLFFFLPITLMAYFFVPKSFKNIVLLLASLFFYAWGEPVYVVLMLFSAAFNYIFGLDIGRRIERGARGAKANLILAVGVNLFLLGFFKYSGFLVETVNALTGLNLPYRALPLPIGISFYTFQTMSYLIDVYRGKVRAQRSLLNFSLYVTMFPQLIAGPIVRYSDIEPALEQRSVGMVKFGAGAADFILGLAKKVLLANNLGKVFSTVQLLAPGEASVLTAWVGIFAYTLQIYFDFSGYSDMAVGLGKMFGFNFMQNFDYPYISKSITEFWRRWHISLSSWFREYVYIPLGGNRVPVLKHLRNIMVVWMLTGLWHGASWNFVLWGLYYGVLLCLEKYLLGRVLSRMPAWGKRTYTMVLVIVGWVLFSNTSLQGVGAYLGNMVGIGAPGFADGAGLYLLLSNLVLFVLGILACGPLIARGLSALTERAPWAAALVLMLVLVLCIAYLVFDTYNPFLYFRF